MVILIDDITPPPSSSHSLNTEPPNLVDQEYARAIASLINSGDDTPNLDLTLDDIPQIGHSRSASDGTTGSSGDTIKHGNEVGTYVDVEVQTEGLGESTSGITGAQDGASPPSGSLDATTTITPPGLHKDTPTHQESFATFYTCACSSEGHDHSNVNPKSKDAEGDPSSSIKATQPTQTQTDGAAPSPPNAPDTPASQEKEVKSAELEVTPKEKPPNTTTITNTSTSRPTSSQPKNDPSPNGNSTLSAKPPTPSPSPPPPPPPKPTNKVTAVTNKIADTISAMESQYMNMLLALDKIPPAYTLLANFFTWILLAGFLLFPGTFTSLQTVQNTSSNEVERKLVSAITHVPLFVIAFLCTGIGAAGMCWLWWRWKYNYIWVTEKIFIPGLMNSIAGIISTLSSVFGAQGGEFSKTSKITIVVTSTIAVICGLLVVIYQFWLLRTVKQRHDEEVGEEKTGKHGEGVLDTSKRKS
ncbi:hypothetical protein BDN72DRAFT_839599 [Pluteus cervinus]|uniref:Uncharacterized protein n=1 Tax=Pluteus cervinus TaxID=181527 RepID=A0ACD3AW85_9AGAR|nr:hypothetical protein BDN72DRAFT_839599 [Pluteus cervinus]